CGRLRWLGHAANRRAQRPLICRRAQRAAPLLRRRAMGANLPSPRHRLLPSLPRTRRRAFGIGTSLAGTRSNGRHHMATSPSSAHRRVVAAPPPNVLLLLSIGAGAALLPHLVE